jgi:hypothetical protein
MTDQHGKAATDESVGMPETALWRVARPELVGYNVIRLSAVSAGVPAMDDMTLCIG